MRWSFGGALNSEGLSTFAAVATLRGAEGEPCSLASASLAACGSRIGSPERQATEGAFVDDVCRRRRGEHQGAWERAGGAARCAGSLALHSLGVGRL